MAISPTKMFSVLLCTILFLSCSKPLDFDQLDQFAPSQILSLPFVLFSLDEDNFVDSNGQDLDSISQSSDFKLLDGTFFEKSLLQLDFDFEIINGIDRDFKLEIKLRELDPDLNNPASQGRLVYELDPIIITASSKNPIPKVVMNTDNFPELFKFRRVEVKLTLDPSGPIMAAEVGDFEFKSLITVYLKGSL
jgi:hypothetical protein